MQQQVADKAGIKFGLFWLVPGISRLNACTFFVSSFSFVTLVTFLNFVQPFILEEVLHIPGDEQGRVTGFLNFIHEGTALGIMAIVGALSDRRGRRTIIIIGYMIMCVAFILFPLADSLLQLYLYRLIFAVGVATASVMVITTMQDYPQEVSRGTWGGFNSFLTSFAILAVIIVLARLPGSFMADGYSAVEAGRYTFWVGAVLAAIAAVIFRIGFFGGRISSVEAKQQSVLAGALEGLRAAKGRPALALSYGSAFAARGDLVVVGAFYSLWFTVAGREQGIESAEAIKAAGISMSALLLANVLWAPIFGYILDRINRVLGMFIAMSLAAVGYFAIGSVDDPFNMPVMMTATFILGLGEISAIVAGNALLGQEAPKDIRGASVGVFSLIGTTGILCATFFGGMVFDAFGPGAPFLMMAGVNALIVVWALFVILGQRQQAAVTQS